MLGSAKRVSRRVKRPRRVLSPNSTRRYGYDVLHSSSSSRSSPTKIQIIDNQKARKSNRIAEVMSTSRHAPVDLPTAKKIVKKIRKNKKKNKKAQNIGGAEKWRKYRTRIKYLITAIEREEHFLGVFAYERGRGDSVAVGDEAESKRRLSRAKQRILDTFAAIEDEGRDLVCFPELQTSAAEVSVGDLPCSVCGLQDEENNDILLCDRAGCNKLYHQMCLDPPMVIVDEGSADWFCPLCDCIDDCLARVNEAFGTAHGDWRHLFPDTHSGVYEEYGASSDGDEDYSPCRDDASSACDDVGRSDACDGDSDDGLCAVDDDELQGLVADAGGEAAVYWGSLPLDGGGGSRRRTRGRARGSEVGLKAEFGGPLDVVGARVAVSRRGYAVAGTVTAYSGDLVSWSGQWRASFEGEKAERLLAFDALEVAVEAFRAGERIRDRTRLEMEAKALLGGVGEIVEGKRSRKVVDYATLQRELFGGTEDPDANKAEYMPWSKKIREQDVTAAAVDSSFIQKASSTESKEQHALKEKKNCPTSDVTLVNYTKPVRDLSSKRKFIVSVIETRGARRKRVRLRLPNSKYYQSCFTS